MSKQRALACFLLCYLLFIIVNLFLLKSNIISWPIHSVNSLSEAFKSIIEYISISFLYILQLFWLPKSEITQYTTIKLNKKPVIFYAGLAISLCYSANILISKNFNSIVFWVPVIILSLLNSVIEEVVYRLILLTILKKVLSNLHSANFLQALLYSIPHFYIDTIFGLKALIYGVLLGYVMIENKSIVPSIVCHFTVDIGAIGVVMMTY